MTHCPLVGRGVVGSVLVSTSVPGASSAWGPLHQEPFAKLWEAYSFEGSEGPECFQQRLRYCARRLEVQF